MFPLVFYKVIFGFCCVPPVSNESTICMESELGFLQSLKTIVIFQSDIFKFFTKKNDLLSRRLPLSQYWRLERYKLGSA